MMRTQRGTALLEFALVLPFILMLIFTVANFGRAMQRYNGAAKAVRDSVRYLSVQQQGTHADEARNLVIYGNIAGTGTALDPSVTLSQVNGPTWALAGSDPLINTVTIKVTGYTFKPFGVSLFGLALPTITFGDISATMRCPS
jgi:Flp pilus assembly protein TadG